MVKAKQILDLPYLVRNVGNLPNPSAVASGTLIFVPDVGSGILIASESEMWVPVGPQILFRWNIDQSVSGTTLETTVAQPFTIPGGLLGANSQLRFSVSCGSVGSSSKTFRLKRGSDIFVSFSYGNTGNARTFEGQRRFAFKNSVSSQQTLAQGGTVSFGQGGSAIIGTSFSIDFSQTQTFVATLEQGVSTETITLRSLLMEWI